MILIWLFLYGYKNLIAGNLVFSKTMRRGPILYKKSNITHTKFPNETFDAVTCLSVIEQGVNLNLYFKEMSRIIKKDGFLVTSTDYYETPINTKGQQAYGVPIHIFCRDVILQAFKIAQSLGFTLTSPLDLTSSEKVVYWNKFDLNYTFLLFSLQKTG
jgi:SAM-dependent methyltransferase